MILTFQTRHYRDFSSELQKAKQIAEFARLTKSRSSKDVKHIGLPSAISNQILKKYSSNKKLKSIKSVKLTIPGQSIKFDIVTKTITIRCIDLVLQCWFSGFEKINQIEIGEELAHISVTISQPPMRSTTEYLGVDLNTTGHVAVLSNPQTGKVWKLGKEVMHIRQKYKQIRTKLQKQGKYQLLQQLKNRESRIIRNLNHHISKKIIQTAMANNVGIRIENLKGIRKNKNHAKSFRYSLNSWSYYQLQQFLKYKAKLQGVDVVPVDPRYTSKTCSKCGTLGERNGKKFECVRCGHVDHADANASFNIGKPILYCITVDYVANTTKPQNMNQLHADRDVCKGSTDAPQKATLKMKETLESLIV